MKTTDRPALIDLELPLIFDENAAPALPADTGTVLPSPQSLVFIPLPVREQRPRVVIADDEVSVIEALQRSLETQYSHALDVRFWRPGTGYDLVEQIQRWMAEGWGPDTVVIDINMDDGGRHGVHYLEMLRKETGCAALAVVLATGNQYRDLDEGKLTGGTNRTRVSPDDWLKQARGQQPEAILYGKSADAQFLGRIGEHLPEWQRAARRHAWVKLLGNISEVLDGASLKIETVAEKITAFAVGELQVDDAFVRWRGPDDKYKLVAQATTRSTPYVTQGDDLDPAAVPIVLEIVETSREPVVRERLTTEETGSFRTAINDYRFLGVGMVLGDRTVGFITLLRRPERPIFEEELDGQYLRVLARLLASALGRDALMRARQTRLLDFAKAVAEGGDEREVCKALAATLHDELHARNDTEAKATVRLLDFGRGILKRVAHLGMPAEEKDISITDTQSIYAESVTGSQLFRVDDVCSAGWNLRFKNLCKIEGVRSELCAPLLIGKHAIGGANLEHLNRDFYRAHDEGFMAAAAGLAASAIERIRTAQVLEGMTNFVHRFANEDTSQLDRGLRNLLYEFCGYGVLVDLEPKDAGPWLVRHVECKFQSANPQFIRQQIELGYAEQWDSTWVSNLFRQQSWRDNWAAFTENESEFLPIKPTDNGTDKGPAQKADALLWLRRNGEPPHRALLLMWWGLAPPMNDAGKALLSSLARLFSELDGRQQHILELVQENLIGEQAAQIGHVMQHFRHRLGNLTGAMETHIGRIEEAHDRGNQRLFESSLRDLRANAKDIANSFSKSKGYVKKVERTNVALQTLVDKACASGELMQRLGKVSITNNISRDLCASTDAEIASLVLFSLLENALDATEAQPNPTICLSAEQRGEIVALQVMDNGQGVQESFRVKLFQWGETTKADGLGSALPFARTRMKKMNGDLVFPAHQPAIGAMFEMRLPAAGYANQ